MWQHYAAGIAVAWCIVLITVIAIGTIQIWRHFRRPIPVPTSPALSLTSVPHVTIIRPIVGLEPYLNECLASTFSQTYPREKLTISFCIATRDDAALPVLEKLVAEHKDFDARIYVESEDPNLSQQEEGNATSGRNAGLGPNPKIRNMSRAYREAKGDTIWIADCNVWLHEATAGLMVDLLCGFAHGSSEASTFQKTHHKYAFVHQLPLAVDVSHLPPSTESIRDGSSAGNKNPGGGLLEEMFMSTAHVKFYTAISTVGIAPCTVGKSNMFRRSHLDALTQPIKGSTRRSPGIDFFSDNICEDHLIGDLLWKTRVPEAVLAAAALEGCSGETTLAPAKQRWGKHALLVNPPCLQPQYRTRVTSYVARRIRWLRVRKFTVPMATFVEPATESFLASTIIAWVLINQVSLPETWAIYSGVWLMCILAWMAIDRFVWTLLQNWRGNTQGEQATPPVFVAAGRQRAWMEWITAWLGREVLALPVWIWAVLGGTQVVWRGRRFWVGVDMKVHEIESKADEKKKV